MFFGRRSKEDELGGRRWQRRYEEAAGRGARKQFLRLGKNPYCWHNIGGKTLPSAWVLLSSAW